MTSNGLLAYQGAAPILPAISTLGAAVAFCLAIALTVMWVQILRKPLVKLAGAGFGRFHPLGFLNVVVTNVDTWLDATVKGTERAMTWNFHALMWSLSTTARLTADLAQATWQGLDYWKRHTTRHVGAQTGQSISPRVKTLEREYKGIDHRLDRVERREQAQRAVGAAAGTIDHAKLQHGIDKLSKRVGHLAHELDAVEHANAHAGAKARTGAKPVPRTAPRSVPRTRAPARHWSDILTKAAAVGVGLYAIARLGLSWARCGNVKRAGKTLCGMNPDLLESLLGSALLLTSAISLRDLAREMEEPTKLVRDSLHKLIREV